jgi:hypothetical protein
LVVVVVVVVVVAAAAVAANPAPVPPSPLFDGGRELCMMLHTLGSNNTLGNKKKKSLKTHVFAHVQQCAGGSGVVPGRL